MSSSEDRPTPKQVGAQQGQTIVVVAIAMVILVGILGLAIDVGHAYRERQQAQNMADSAAVAGAFEANGIANPAVLTPQPTLTGPLKDARVVTAMKAIVNQDGYTVQNLSGTTLATPPADACAAGYSPSQVYLTAEYLDSQSTPIPNTSPTPGPLQVGSGSYSDSARGVRVMSLGGCIPAYFAPILNVKHFYSLASSRAGQQIASTQVPTPSPTLTPTAPSTQPIGIAPFLILGQPDPNGTAVHSTPARDSWSPYAPYMLFSAGSDAALAASSHVPGGNLVRLVGNASTWAGAQYGNGNDGITNNPVGASLHDASMEGCLQATLLTGYTGENISAYTAGGLGGGSVLHCAPFPPVGSVVTIPVTSQACKGSTSITSGSTPTPTATATTGCGSGGYDYVIQAFVNIRITVSNLPNDLQGYIAGVVYDYYHIIDPALPTPTATPNIQPVTSGN